jgi:hypothetical protein
MQGLTRATQRTGFGKIMRLLSIGLTGCLLSSGAQTQWETDLFSGTSQIRDIVIPIFIAPEQRPSAVLRVHRIYADYERRGFFRIGVLPIAVMEEVSFDVRQPDLAAKSLAELHRWIGTPTAKHLELRQVTFRVAAGVTNCLEVGRIRADPGGKWQLLDGVCFKSGNKELQAAGGTLQVTGAQTGQLIMATTPPCTNNLFARPEAPESPAQSTTP